MMLRRKHAAAWSSTAGSGQSVATVAEKTWAEQRGAGLRWAIAGTVCGLLAGLAVFAPAAWLARAVGSATDDRLVLADARGTLWSGSAVPVLTGGAGSRDASFLPGRLEWSLAPRWYGAELALRQACCIDGALVIQLRPGIGRLKATVAPPAGPIGRWPTALLAGAGVPFNTLQLGGKLSLSSPGFTIETVEGRWHLDGRIDLQLDDVSSRLTTLGTLGSYKMQLNGSNGAGGATVLSLSTRSGPLQIDGSGSVGPGGLRFRGEARATAGDKAALSNLLNIIGRRDGARSIISIG